MNRLILILMIIMSVAAFFMFGIDKRRAVRHLWRIPESALLAAAFLFGGPGALLGMLCFHHKTRKWKFRILVPFFTVLQIMLCVNCVSWGRF